MSEYVPEGANGVCDGCGRFYAYIFGECPACGGAVVDAYDFGDEEDDDDFSACTVGSNG